MTDSIQFSVTRISQNRYKVIVQDEKNIIRSDEVEVVDIMDKLGFELEQLSSK